MTSVRQADLIESIAAALQYISYYHPADYISHLARAYDGEESAAAKDAIAQILTNSRMCAEGRRPICQDTGIVNVFLKIGMNVRLDGFSGGLEEAVNEGVRRGYNHPDNLLRASIVDPPEFARKNTGDNTPAVINVQLVPGDTGRRDGRRKRWRFGKQEQVRDAESERLDRRLGAADSADDGRWMVPAGHARHRHRRHRREGDAAGQGSADGGHRHVRAKQRGAGTDVEKLRIELYDKVNALGIGAQGLGGLTTVLDIKIKMYPTHAAGKPVAMIPNCAATRHAHFVLDGSGPAYIEPPSLDLWPDVNWQPDYNRSTRVNLDTLTKEQVASWAPGQTLLLSGRMLTGRDAAHKRIADMLARKRKATGRLHQPRDLLRRPGRSGA